MNRHRNTEPSQSRLKREFQGSGATLRRTLAGAALVTVSATIVWLGGTSYAQDRLSDRFRKLDANGDGVLTNSEVDSPDLFNRLDLNSDGKVTKSEALAAVRDGALNAQPSPRRSSPPPKSRMSPQSDEQPDTASAIRQGPRPIKPGEAGVGRRIEDLEFADLHGRTHSLSDFAEKRAIVIAMTGTGCPLCLKYAPSLAAIERRYAAQGVAFVFVNPTESEKVADLQEAVRTHKLQGSYVHDKKKRLTAALGARTTTEVFVLDRARTLRYRGAVDDQYGFAYALKKPRRNYLTDALDSLLVGESPGVTATSSPGCDLFFDKATKLADASPLTYHNRISRIVQNNCVECHRQGGIAPFALETYEEVKDYAGMIRNVVERGVMPPWFAAEQPRKEGESLVAHWSNDRSLSANEKQDLFAWIKAGAPRGDAKDAPLPKKFPDGWLIGKPDAVFEFPRPVPVKATGIMPYKTVQVETNFPEDKWVQAIEIRPGQPDVVHHVIVRAGNGLRRIDEADGYWAAYVPGNSTLAYPDGYAKRLPKGATLRFQMHYTPNGKATEDSTRIGLIFAKEPPEHEVRVAGIANRRIRIPPGAGNHPEFATLKLPYDVQVLGFLAHMHLRGKAAKYELENSQGAETLLDIPRYDFNWQLMYRLAEPRLLKQGETVRFTAWFDNSENNPANPDPTTTVRWGQQTEDEMHIGYVEYVVPSAKPGESPGGLRRGRAAGAIGRAVGNRLFARLDADSDGFITRDEVRRRLPGNQNAAGSIFDRLDQNNDDKLDQDEFSKLEQLMRR